MTTAEKIRAARKNAGLTQKQLGDLCGIAEPTIRKYELGKLNPKKETLEKIAKPLNVFYLDLYGDAETELVKTGVDLGKNFARTASAILTRMDVVGEFEEQGYTFEPEERRLVCAFNKMNPVSRVQILTLTESMAEIPRFMLEPPGPQEAPPKPPPSLDSTEGKDTTPPPNGSEVPQEDG